MTKEFFIRVSTDPGTELEDLASKLEKIKGFKFYEYTPQTGEIEKDWLIEVGQTLALQTEDVSEALGTTSHQPNDIKELIQKFLDKIITTNQLLIVDRFIFPTKRDSNYPNFLCDLLDKYIGTLEKIIFITSPSYERPVQVSVETLLKSKKPTLNIEYKFSDEYHDRFWISDFDKRGVFLGTSLNGYGRKYALVDYINISDVRQIVSSLRDEGLL